MSCEENDLFIGVGELGRLVVSWGMLHDVQCQEMLWSDLYVFVDMCMQVV